MDLYDALNTLLYTYMFYLNNFLSYLFPSRPIRQHATGRQGLYRTLLVEQKSLPLEVFRELAEDPCNAPPAGEPEALERKFWKNVPMNPPLYGADVPGSLFDERARSWSLKHLSSVLSRTLDSSGASIPGVTQPYLYAGSWRAFFAWHTEDMDLHSVNYLHVGAPKTWYVVPPAARERFELTVRDLLPELSRSCPEFLRHKEILLSPALLAAHNIPLVKVLHREREFVVVGPGAYHAGFNHGFNLAESVNFATPAWVPIGARASFCTCRPDSVKIDMRLFLDYMDEELAEEVKDSYTDSDQDSDEDDEEEEEESDAEEGREWAQRSGVERISHSASECCSSEEDEEGEPRRVPSKRVRRPSAKALESLGLVRRSYVTGTRQLRRLNEDATDEISPPSRKAIIRRGRLDWSSHKEQKLAAVSHGVGGPNMRRGIATKRYLGPATRKRGRRNAETAVQAAAVLHASSSSDEDSPAPVGSRPLSTRGAAAAWYRLFDSLLPALKRARA